MSTFETVSITLQVASLAAWLVTLAVILKRR